jgi:hypothetical protein
VAKQPKGVNGSSVRWIEMRTDQRRGQRFPICERIRYKILGIHPTILGQGTTLNISRSGIQFTTEDRIPVGCLVEVSVNWPATIDGCALNFVARGRVVRSANEWAAIKMEDHELRTRGVRVIPDARGDGARVPRVVVQ